MKFSAVFALILAAASPLPAAATPADTAAALLSNNQQALVEIQGTLSIKPEVIDGPPGIADMMNQQPENQQPVETNGVVIHASGLVVAPLAPLDPGAAVGGGMELDTPLGKLKLGLKTNVSTLKIVTGDGHEYPAEIILRDATAGMALLKLTTPPDGGIKPVELTKDLPAPPPFATVFDLVRLSADFGRAPSVRMMRVVQMTPPPVPLIDVTGPLAAPGSAGFDAAGHFLGITVVPLRKKEGLALSAPEVCILPVAEILRLSAKALP